MVATAFSAPLSAVLALAMAAAAMQLPAAEAAGAWPRQAGAGAQPDPGSGRRSILDGIFTLAQASRGRQRFQQVCAACHSVSDHAGGRFATRWADTTVGELLDLISMTMPESDPGSLKPEEYADIVAFFLEESGYPAGSRELPSDAASLMNVRIEPPSK